MSGVFTLHQLRFVLSLNTETDNQNWPNSENILLSGAHAQMIHLQQNPYTYALGNITEEEENL